MRVMAQVSAVAGMPERKWPAQHVTMATATSPMWQRAAAHMTSLMGHPCVRVSGCVSAFFLALMGR